MDKAEEIAIIADLENSYCQLRHESKHKAVDVIIVPFGYKENEDVYKQEGEFVIPICEECIEKLYSHFTLIYCLACNSSMFINHNNSKLDYTNKRTGNKHRLIWLNSCPDCDGEFKNIWFD
jgi:hypothetical protein